MPLTSQQFIENWPLYTRAAIRDFSAPRSITRMCGRCKKETTWTLRSQPHVGMDTKPAASFECAGYTCELCEENSLVVMYRKLDWHEDANSRVSPKLWSYFAVHKIGQLPPQSVDISSDLSQLLGNTATYYRNALVCRGQNYGIGAVAYMRRVIEEKTDGLIDVIIELAQTYSADAETVEALKRAKTQIRYEDKLQVASELVPPALRPGGVNPLGQLYVHLSVGLHGKSDDECIGIFDDLREDFEYVFRNLRIEAEQRKQFAHRVQNRAGRNPEKAG